MASRGRKDVGSNPTLGLHNVNVEARNRALRAHSVTRSPLLFAASSMRFRSIGENRSEKTPRASPVGNLGRPIFFLVFVIRFLLTH